WLAVPVGIDRILRVVFRNTFSYWLAVPVGIDRILRVVFRNTFSYWLAVPVGIDRIREGGLPQYGSVTGSPCP
ncbi:hypothetical protein QQ73_09330, partial [Candidatus Endoriftia persephone str. Guaymas]|nr:hypothetical protein [Candidatus Endoriftia persephone str. Guaymas]